MTQKFDYFWLNLLENLPDFIKFCLEKKPFNNANNLTLGEIYKSGSISIATRNLARSSINWKSAEWLKEMQVNKFKSSYYPTDNLFVFNKIITALRIVSCLEDVTDINTVFESHLDICGGTGLMAATFQELGFTKISKSIDIVDRKNEAKLGYESLQRFIKQAFIYHSNNSSDAFTLISSDMKYHGWDSSHFLHQSPASARLSKFLATPASINSKFEPQRQIDVGDFLQHPYNDNTFDLATLYAGMEYFKGEDFFQKINIIIKKAGIFFTSNSYFYEECGASMHLPNVLPWLHIFFSKNDYIQLFSDYYGPDVSELVGHCYYLPESHRSASRQAHQAKQYSLILKYQRRVAEFCNSPEKTLSALNEETVTNSKRYLIETQNKLALFFNYCKPEFNIRPQDLQTYHLLQVYQKL